MKASFGIVASYLAASVAAYPQVLNALSSSDMGALQGFQDEAVQAASSRQTAAADPGMLPSSSFLHERGNTEILSQQDGRRHRRLAPLDSTNGERLDQVMTEGKY